MDIVFAPDGNRRMVVYDLRGSVLDWRRRACARALRNLTAGEWEQYLAPEPYHKTCPEFPGPEDAD